MSSYMLVSLASITLQVILIIHCLKTGRNTLWLWALMLLPAAGSIAYIVVEMLPSLFGSRSTRRAVQGVRKAIDPGRSLRRFEAEARRTGDVASRQRYADELIRQGRASEAIPIYQGTLTGLYATDPGLLFGLAQAQYAANQFADARGTLERLIASNPSSRSADVHLLYAKALASEGKRDQALTEYAALAGYYAGAEAPLRYAELLRDAGRNDDARRVLQELLEHARMAPKHYRKMQQEWLADAERVLASIQPA